MLAIAPNPELEIACRLNRSLANISLQRYGPALADCLYIQENIEGPNVALSPAQQKKLLLRKLRSAYNLRLWNTALTALDDCKLLQVAQDQWLPFQKELAIRQDQLKGHFVWPTLDKSLPGVGENTIRADYIGPIKVVQMEAKGRALVTSRDVQPGEL